MRIKREEEPELIEAFQRQPEIVALGDQLVAAVRSKPLLSYEDDMNLIDEWANILGLQSCYHWYNEVTKKSVFSGYWMNMSR